MQWKEAKEGSGMTGSASKYLFILVELITIIFKSMSFFSCALMRTSVVDDILVNYSH